MSQISAAAVKTLRDRTNAPMMDCKAALTEAGGDMDKAIEILRKSGKAAANKREGREVAEGRIAAYIDPARKVGALVEVRCESAPVAKSELFVQLANDLAKQVTATKPASVDALLAQPLVGDPKHTVNDRIADVIGVIRENMKVARFAVLHGTLGSYCHHDGSVGVMVEAEGTAADPQVLRDVCMHITATNPVSTRREDVPSEVVAREKEIAKGQAEATGKPAQIAEKIAEGKLKTWFAENVLLEQPFVKDSTRTVGDLLKGAGLKPVKFVRYKVGETASAS